MRGYNDNIHCVIYRRKGFKCVVKIIAFPCIKGTDIAILIIVLCTCYVLINTVHCVLIIARSDCTKIAKRNYYMLAFKTRPTVIRSKHTKP